MKIISASETAFFWFRLRFLGQPDVQLLDWHPALLGPLGCFFLPEYNFPLGCWRSEPHCYLQVRVGNIEFNTLAFLLCLPCGLMAPTACLRQPQILLFLLLGEYISLVITLCLPLLDLLRMISNVLKLASWVISGFGWLVTSSYLHNRDWDILDSSDIADDQPWHRMLQWCQRHRLALLAWLVGKGVYLDLRKSSPSFLSMPFNMDPRLRRRLKGWGPVSHGLTGLFNGFKQPFTGILDDVHQITLRTSEWLTVLVTRGRRDIQSVDQ